MRKFISIALSSLFAASVFFAQVAVAATPSAPAASPCEAKAVSKDGKPLVGAAKASSIKKCEADAVAASGCAGKALDKNGKPLAGAAKNSFMKKCVVEFQTSK
jgi:hypothetical protein